MINTGDRYEVLDLMAAIGTNVYSLLDIIISTGAGAGG